VDECKPLLPGGRCDARLVSLFAAVYAGTDHGCGRSDVGSERRPTNLSQSNTFGYSPRHPPHLNPSNASFEPSIFELHGIP